MSPATANRIRFCVVLSILLGMMGTQSAHAGCNDKRAPGVDWSGCKKTGKMMGGSNFAGGRFDEANLYESLLDGVDFSRASLVKTDLSRVSATRSHFDNSDLSKAVGYRANFDGATVFSSRLLKSEFSRATFVGARVVDVDWSRSELGRVDFRNARLQNVNFMYSNLSRAIFAGASLDNIVFFGTYTYLTHFEDTDLGAVRKLSQKQLDIACGNDNTRLPPGLTRPDSWPCEE